MSIIQQVLKLGIKNIDEIECLFNTLSPTVDQINLTDNHGDTLVHFAARSHSLPLLKTLYKYHANMEAINEHGRRPIHEAIDNLECVAYLLEICNVDCNALKRGDWTPVMIAAYKGNLPVVQCLVNNKACLYLSSKDGKTPLHMAISEGHVDVAKYLILCYPQSMFTKTKIGRLPIQMATVLRNDYKYIGETIARFILNNLTSKEQQRRMVTHHDQSGRTVLEDAVVANQMELFSWFLTFGANPHHKDALGRNCWHHAAMVGNMEMLTHLKKHHLLGWDEADNWDKWTPLMYAVKNRHKHAVAYFLKMGADVLKKDKLNRTAKDLAKLWQDNDIINLMNNNV
ncbi:unnamed protein product [Cunninghamella blakesleeana]